MELYRYYFLYETDNVKSNTISFIANSLPEAYKKFEEKLGKPEPQIIDVHSEPIPESEQDELLKTMLDWHEKMNDNKRFNIPLDHEQSEYLTWLSKIISSSYHLIKK